MTTKMIDESKYSKLTPSAKAEMEKITDDFSKSLFDKAYNIANERETASKEISLRDILEAQQQINQMNNKIKSLENKKYRFLFLVSFSATIYAIGGILIYLFLNKDFSIEKDLGLIIAVIGVLLALFSILYTQMISKREYYKSLGLIKDSFNLTDSFDLVRRWQIIEELSKKLMSESDKEKSTSNSLGFQIRFLSHKIAKDEKEFLKIRELLQLRNKILHENYRLSSKEFSEFLQFADELINRLEFLNVQQSKNMPALRIIKATYGTSKKSVDATKELNLLINNNRLEFIANNEIVGDPDDGTIKSLSITYEISGKQYTKTFKEGDKVIIDK
jgi:hypothetical protein